MSKFHEARLAEEARITLASSQVIVPLACFRYKPRKRRTWEWGELSEMVDLSLARSGERFSLPDPLIELSRWGHFASCSIPWEKFDPL